MTFGFVFYGISLWAQTCVCICTCFLCFHFDCSLFPQQFVCVVLLWFVFILSYLITILGAHLYSNEKQKECGFGWIHKR